MEAAGQTCQLLLSWYIDTRPASPSTDPRTQGAWEGCHWSTSSHVVDVIQPGKRPTGKGRSNPGLPQSGLTSYRWTNELLKDYQWKREGSQTGQHQETAGNVTLNLNATYCSQNCRQHNFESECHRLYPKLQLTQL